MLSLLGQFDLFKDITIVFKGLFNALWHLIWHVSVLLFEKFLRRAFLKARSFAVEIPRSSALDSTL